MEKKYWESYYKNHKNPFNPSNFAKFISQYLEKGKLLIELGCGNGRDSIYFSKLGLKVLGIDQCAGEINHLNKSYSSKNLLFKKRDFTKMTIVKKYDYIYSRFTLHSIGGKAENRVLNWGYNSLKLGGLFFFEIRSIKDEMFKKGNKIGYNEIMTDHYRRFADFIKLKDKLKKIGFSIIYSIESKGLAIHNKENPVIIRIIAKK